MNGSVQRLPKNTKGRDFVTGDIHGAYELVWQGMQKVGFDLEKDRLFVPGDLIDRGDQSIRVVRFLQLPCVFSTRGNHEQMYCDLFEKGDPDPELLEILAARNFNGMRWLTTITPADRRHVYEAVKDLPVAIEVETDRGTVGFVHADVPQGMDWQTFLAHIEAGDQAVIDHAIGMSEASRDRVETGRTEGVPGVGRLFVGHTPQMNGMLKLGNVYVMDTGAIFGQMGRGGRLTMAQILSQTQDLTAPPQDGSAIVDIRNPDVIPDRPFTAIQFLDETASEASMGMR